MAEAADDSRDIEKLYEYVEKLNEAKDKAQNQKDYEGIIAAANGSVKAKQLAAQLIPKFFKYFPELSEQALDQHLYLCEDEELAVRIQAIRGLPLFCKDTPEHLAKIVDILAQLLIAGDNVERDAVHKALMSLLRQDVKTSLTALFKHIGGTDDRNTEDISAWETIREKVLCFIRDKVFPLKAELLKPKDEMERHITNLVKQNLQDVTAEEFKMFMDFLKNLSLFGQNAPMERIQELVEIIEGQADLNAQFNVSDGDHIVRFIACLQMAIPFFMRGASSSKFFNYLSKQILPVFDKLPEERRLDLLKNLAECSSYATSQDSRQVLPSIVQLLKKYMVRRKIEEINFTFIECLLYAFHHLAHKAPNATNSLCGYKIVTGQPSDRLGEDFSEQYKDFTERLSTIEELAKAMNKKLTQGMAEHNKAMAAAKTEEEKEVIKKQKQNATAGLRSCNNILAMTQPLHSKAPSFIGDQKISLSWKEVTKAATPPTAAGQKRAANAANGSGSNANKKGRGAGGLQNQLVNKAFEGLNNARTGGRGRGWRGRGRGRGAYR
ncbi:Apoptosis inhibitor 5/fibroblast growth factor 2-interacting factor 2 [Handroanthus impetiginosus]|uniref:Apoptosis inhibitor 5/fibroblast growth factor 2-interacting factor 2 n=1 Tax=Handroanthus impetiginosus TaxID=429701 RepID=A0A2G9HET9_9LAMI|nr:Apoptosis inhibitor 5/fibroblast growth factor 2-interacting factor 2 [Handroanthus impetiginosus]